jgi:hypothetical protein
LAKKFANQLSEPAVAKCVGRLKMLMALERACKLRQGDVLVELLDGHGVRAIDIARITGRRPNDLSQQYNTAKLFPPKLREPDLQYNTYFMAMRMIRKFDTLSLAPAAVLGEIRRIGYSQHRDVPRHFAQLARAAEMRRALPVPQTAAPYSRQTEMLWMLSRPGDALLNHDGSSRSDILRFPPVSFPGLADRQDHCFEKPQEMSEFLIQKHSHSDELVLDLCGCTASTTLAAIETGRQWIYVESNSQNFEIGAARIAQRLNGRTASAS